MAALPDILTKIGKAWQIGGAVKSILEPKLRPILEKYPDITVGIEWKLGKAPFPDVPPPYQKLFEKGDTRIIWRPSKVFISEVIKGILRYLAPGLALGFMAGLAFAYLLRR